MPLCYINIVLTRNWQIAESLMTRLLLPCQVNFLYYLFHDVTILVEITSRLLKGTKDHRGWCKNIGNTPSPTRRLNTSKIFRRQLLKDFLRLLRTALILPKINHPCFMTTLSNGPRKNQAGETQNRLTGVKFSLLISIKLTN